MNKKGDFNMYNALPVRVTRCDLQKRGNLFATPKSRDKKKDDFVSEEELRKLLYAMYLLDSKDTLKTYRIKKKISDELSCKMTYSMVNIVGEFRSVIINAAKGGLLSGKER